VNSWDNEKVAIDMAKYDICVFGNGVADPGHPDYANAQIIIARLKAIKPDMMIFGYASANQILGDFQTKVNQWEVLEIDGIFIDEAGYDYGVTRDVLNAEITHIRSKTYATICFVNSWNMDHIIGIVDDPSYPNTTFNPDLHISLLDSRDFYLLESFSVNTVSYSANDGYATKTDFLARSQKAIEHSYTFGINLAVVGVINNDNVSGQNLFNFNYHSAIIIGAETVGSSDTNYGSGSAAVKFWTRISPKHIGRTGSVVIAQSLSDIDVIMRFGDYSLVALDFSTGGQISSIQKW